MSFNDWADDALANRATVLGILLRADLTDDERARHSQQLLGIQAEQQRRAALPRKRLIFVVDPPPQLPTGTKGGQVRKR